jgi:PAS domain S-box-containing protein
MNQKETTLFDTSSNRYYFAGEHKELDGFFEMIPSAIIVIDHCGKITLMNSQAESMFNYSHDELLGKPVEILLPETLRHKHIEHRHIYFRGPQAYSVNKVVELLGVRKDGTQFPVDINLRPIQAADGFFVSAVIQDMTSFMQTNEEQRIGEEYTHAILNSVKAQIALLDKEGIIQDVNLAWKSFAKENGGSPTTHSGKGLNYLRICRQARGDSSEGAKAIADGIEVVIRGEKPIFSMEYSCHSLTEKSWFLCQVTPLPTAHGGVVVSHINITEQIKAQKELIQSYESTLEGWSRAMDLRDKETEGHTQRVADLTVRIARAMGLDESDIVNMRRGALLHDMGKLGIPDNILLKPGKLSDEEWSIMRKHPQFAYEMLLPVDFLRLALDIPYCHHEKWDGSGYPRGLKGEEIPLAARIFAVTDVWDAFRSDRPYREGWPAEKVRDYIRSQSGKHFDPNIIEVFLGLMDESGRE